MALRKFGLVFAIMAGAVAPASAYDNCYCVDGYLICNDSSAETYADDNYEYVPQDTYPNYSTQQEYFYTAPDTSDQTYDTVLPEPDPPTTSERSVSYSPPAQDTATWDESPSYETYQSPSLRLPECPPELLLGILAIILLVIIGAIVDHFTRIHVARDTDAALNDAA